LPKLRLCTVGRELWRAFCIPVGVFFYKFYFVIIKVSGVRVVVMFCVDFSVEIATRARVSVRIKISTGFKIT